MRPGESESPSSSTKTAPRSEGSGSSSDAGDASLEIVRPFHKVAPYATAATAGFAAVAAAVLFGRPILGHDDVWIRAIADGTYTGEPSERLIFMNSVLGWLLRSGYTVFPNVAWYALLLYGLIAVSIALVAWLLISRPPKVRIAVLLVGVYFVARSLVVLSWTETGLLVVGAGVVIALCGPSTRKVAIISGLLIAVGFMVRTESIGVVLAVIPLLWVSRDRWRHLFLVLLVSAAVIGPAYVYDRLHYASDPKWAEWFEFEDIRRYLHGTPRVTLDREMSDVLAAAGWSENDLLVFLAWYYADEEVFSTESIATIYDARRFVTAEPGGKLAEVARRHAVGLAFIAVALGLAGARRWWVAMGSAAWLLVLFTAMEVTFRSRPRIEAVIILAVAVALVLLLHDRDRSIQPFLVLALVVLTLPSLIDLSSATVATRANLARDMGTLEQLDPDAIYIQVGSALALQGVGPFDGGAPPVKVVLTGWTVRSPHFAAHLEQAGIADLYVDPIRRRDVLLVGRENNVASVVEFMREHYDVDPLVERVQQLDGRVEVWQLTESA